MSPSVRLTKRALDVMGAVVGLAATLPLFPIIGAAIYFDSPGPLFYRQRRAGRLIGPNGDGFRFAEFDMFKFRTMRTDAEKHTGAVLAGEGDPRVTRVGRILRKSRLDELPQFLNVLLGEMSLVGPRPERPELLNNLALAIPFFEERMRDVKPGITGLAQITLGYSGRAPDGSPITTFQEQLANPFKVEGADGAVADDMRLKMLFDLAYCASLEKFSSFIATELSVIARTPLVMLKGLGALTLTVAHVLSSFGMGGQERVALDLAVGQIAAGCRVLAISLAPPPDGPLRADFLACGAEVHTVPKRGGFDAALPLRLASLLRRRGVEIVHTHNPQPLIYGAPAARLAGARAIHTKHGANPDVGRRLWLRRAAAQLTDAYVAVSSGTAEVARRNREAPARALRTVPNGIDLARFHPDAAARAAVRAELGIGAAASVVITVGRLAHEKDQALLVRAMAPQLAEATRLVIVGDGPEAGALRAQIDALAGALFVHLTGARRDVPRLLAAADVFALSSRTEGLPLVLPEAMAAGLPVVSTAVGGIGGVIDEGETGYLVPPGDEAALRTRLTALTSDGALAARLGQRAREIALDRYAAARMVRDYLALYQAALRR